MKMSKAGYFFSLYGLLIIAAAVIAWNQRSVNEAKAPEAPTNQITQLPTAANLKQYNDTTAGYSFSYPSDIFGVYDKQLQLPFLNAKKLVDAVALVHTVPVEHCGLSGLPQHCTPSTTDISVSFAPLNYTIDTIKKGKYGSDLVHTTINDMEAWTVDMGVEGEGRVDVYFPVTETSTLWISRTYINGQILSKYQSVPQFITFQKQAQIFEQILNSIKIAQ
jgi:hypothetical protein